MNVFQMSISAGILILLIISLRFLTIHKLRKNLFVVLWKVVLLRLLLPITIPMKFSLASFFTMLSDKNEVVTSRQNIASFPYMEVASGSEVITSVSTYDHKEIPLFFILWLVGAILLLSFFSFTYIRVFKKMQEALPVKDIDFINRWLLRYSRNRKLKILSSDRISTPIAFGIVVPKIILPKIMNISDTSQLECALTHELVHIKRYDNLWKILSVIALCIHWFNPLVWIMYLLFNRDLELSCDEKVIAILGENEKQNYALALIHLAEQKTGIYMLYNGFGNNAIKERISAVMKYRKVSVLGIGFSVILILASANVFAVAKTSENTKSSYEDEKQVKTENSNEVTKQESTDNSYEVTNQENTVNSFEAANQVTTDNSYEAAKQVNTLLTDDLVEILKLYEPFGLSYDFQEDEMYYKGNIVRELYDEKTGTFIARTLGDSFLEGSIDVRCIYQDNTLISLRIATEEEYNQRTEERIARSKKNKASQPNETLEMANLIYESAQFPEYEKLGLSYYEEKGKLIYKEQIVGYFMDELEEDTYCRFTDYTGTIGIKAVRDKDNSLTGFEEVNLDVIFNSSVVAEENNEENKEEINSEVTYNSSAVETGGSDADTLDAYTDLGVTFNKKKNCWVYNNKNVAVLIDGDYIYMNEDVSSEKAVYLQVMRKDNGNIKTIQEISKSEEQEFIKSAY